MPQGVRRDICLETGKKPDFPRKRRFWKMSEEVPKVPIPEPELEVPRETKLKWLWE